MIVSIKNKAYQRQQLGLVVHPPLLPTLDSNEFLKFTAVHESAHAVAALELNETLRTVEVIPTDRRTDFGGGLGGQVIVSSPVSAPQDRLRYLYAGREANLRWLGLKGIDTPENRVDVMFLARHDVALVRALAVKDQIDLDRGDREARGSVERNWGSIKAVADELANRHLLTPAEVKAIVG